MPEKQFVAAKVAIWEDDKLFVIHEPKHGRWSLPGGRVEPGEDPIECLMREIEEEIGPNQIDIQPQPVGIYPTISPRSKDGFFILVYEGKPESNIIISEESEINEAKFVSFEEFKQLPFSDLHKGYTEDLFHRKRNQ